MSLSTFVATTAVRRHGLALAMGLCLLVLSTPASATPDPDQVLADETVQMRDLLSDNQGFTHRMARYRSYAEMLSGLQMGGTLESALDMLREAKPFIMMLAATDQDLAFLPGLVNTFEKGGHAVQKLSQFSAKMQRFNQDFDTLLTQPALRPDQMKALQQSIPAGQQAMRDYAQLHTELQPLLRDFEQQLEIARRDLDQLMRQGAGNMGPLLALLQQQMGGQVPISIDTLFDEARQMKRELDTMAAQVDADVATLNTLNKALDDAYAHHQYAQAALDADALAAQGDKDAAHQRMLDMAAAYPSSSWADKARDHAASFLAVASDDAGSESLPAVASTFVESNGLWLWPLFGGMALGVMVLGGFFVMRRRAAMPDAPRSETRETPSDDRTGGLLSRLRRAKTAPEETTSQPLTRRRSRERSSSVVMRRSRR